MMHRPERLQDKILARWHERPVPDEIITTLSQWPMFRYYTYFSMTNRTLRSIGQLPVFARGFIAGGLATLPMTLAMTTLHKAFHRTKKHPLPPEKVSMEVLEATSIKEKRDGKPRHRLFWLSHLLYGACAGALYVPFAQRGSLAPVIQGGIYGIVIWALSYLGILPSLKLYPSPIRQSAQTQVEMVTAHIVWGTILGVLVDQFLHPRRHRYS